MNTDNFNRDLHMNQLADYILTNRPFNMSDWRGETRTFSVGRCEGIP